MLMHTLRTNHMASRSATGKCKASSLQVQRSPILPPCVLDFYTCLRFSATRDTTSSTNNHCLSALQRLLNDTLYGYLSIRHRPVMCVSLPMNASSWAFVLPSTHDYVYDNTHARATEKPAHCKFKGRTFSANFVAASNSTNACSLSTTDHPCAWTVSMPAKRFSVWTSPCETTTILCVLYGESYTHTYMYGGRVALL